jgi:hypothetical protein
VLAPWIVGNLELKRVHAFHPGNGWLVAVDGHKVTVLEVAEVWAVGIRAVSPVWGTCLQGLDNDPVSYSLVDLFCER